MTDDVDGAGVTNEELRALLVHQRYRDTVMLAMMGLLLAAIGVTSPEIWGADLLQLAGLFVSAVAALKAQAMNDRPFANRILARFGWPNEMKLSEVDR